MIVKVAPVSIVTGNEGLGMVQEKEDRWVPVDAMLHLMFSCSTGQDGNKGAKWNSGGVASDRIPSTTPGAEPPRGAKDSGSARSHSTHLETSSQKRP